MVWVSTVDNVFAGLFGGLVGFRISYQAPCAGWGVCLVKSLRLEWCFSLAFACLQWLVTLGLGFLRQDPCPPACLAVLYLCLVGS